MPISGIPRKSIRIRILNQLPCATHEGRSSPAALDLHLFHGTVGLGLHKKPRVVDTLEDLDVHVVLVINYHLSFVGQPFLEAERLSGLGVETLGVFSRSAR